MPDWTDPLTGEQRKRLYAEWVAGQMKRRRWDQAMLARRSALRPQTINDIVKGKASQPSAAQVAGLARAFKMDPAEVLSALRLWEMGRSGAVDFATYLRSTSYLTEDQIQTLAESKRTFERENRINYVIDHLLEADEMLTQPNGNHILDMSDEGRELLFRYLTAEPSSPARQEAVESYRRRQEEYAQLQADDDGRRVAEEPEEEKPKKAAFGDPDLAEEMHGDVENFEPR